MTGPAPLGPPHTTGEVRGIPSDTNSIAPPRRTQATLFTGGWMAYAPPDKYTTRAPNSILLGRPLTMGEMRANVSWRARR